MHVVILEWFKIHAVPSFSNHSRFGSPPAVSIADASTRASICWTTRGPYQLPRRLGGRRVRFTFPVDTSVTVAGWMSVVVRTLTMFPRSRIGL